MPPRMTSTQMGAISSPTAGMAVYNTTAGCIFTYNGSVWESESNSNTPNIYGSFLS